VIVDELPSSFYMTRTLIPRPRPAPRTGWVGGLLGVGSETATRLELNKTSSAIDEYRPPHGLRHPGVDEMNTRTDVSLHRVSSYLPWRNRSQRTTTRVRRLRRVSENLMFRAP